MGSQRVGHDWAAEQQQCLFSALKICKGLWKCKTSLYFCIPWQHFLITPLHFWTPMMTLSTEKLLSKGVSSVQFSSVKFSRSVMSDSLRPHESQHARPPSPSPTPGVHSDSHPSSQWCHPAISSSVVPFSSCPPIPPSIRVFSNESALRMRWPKYWSFSFSIIPSKEIPGLISLRMDWLNLLAVQGTLKSLLQHHSSKVSILQRSALTLTSTHDHRKNHSLD